MKISAFTLVQDGEGSVLFLRRGPTDPWMPGRWNFPGGGLNVGETHLRAAVRELGEEAGIDADPRRMAYLGKFKTGRMYTMHLYGLRLKSRPPVHSRDGEHDAYVWAELQNAPQPLLPWINRMIA